MPSLRPTNWRRDGSIWGRHGLYRQTGDGPPIRLYVAASGPRARSLTAKLGAGWIATGGDVEGAITAMADMRERWQAAGRGAEPLDAVVMTGGAILEEG